MSSLDELWGNVTYKILNIVAHDWPNQQTVDRLASEAGADSVRLKEPEEPSDEQLDRAW